MKIVVIIYTIIGSVIVIPCLIGGLILGLYCISKIPKCIQLMASEIHDIIRDAFS